MARKPITTYAGGKGPRQLIWEAIRARRGEEWTRYQIARAANINDETVGTYVLALQKAGIVKQTRREKVSSVAGVAWYKLERDEGIEALIGRVTQRQRKLLGRTAHASGGDAAGASLACGASVAGVETSPPP